ncbi:SMI1/KNR4 family protein [Metabacillus litoralis]|uniref:SMI1/KNR4 family protein n=1 Tax=Metabacillus TaxID=2675233 RepID=UPI001B90FF7E|nr:SMI1/KNR4 family protein [Metabacillus litoralis]UHA58788.1 SMI1/KNR4 family protein [Metabacillus litoralis]
MKKEYYQGKGFWSEQYSWDYEPVTDGMIEEAERQLQLKLPLSYISLLKEQNGGSVNYDRFDHDGDRSVWMDHMEGIDLEVPHHGNGILASEYWIEECNLPVSPSTTVILWGDFHHFIALDYSRAADNPSVVQLWETWEKEDPWGKTHLASTFGEFLSKLYRETKFEPKKIKNKTKYKQQFNPKYLKF